MSKEFAARHVAGRRVVIQLIDGNIIAGKALALVNTGNAIAISMYVGRGKYPKRACLNDIQFVCDATSGREIK
jgi:hypothetical protein